MKKLKNILLMVFAIVIVLANTSNSYATEMPLDGTYEVELTFTGGTGRVKANTHTELNVSNGSMTAKIILSSSNYTYMIVEGEYYYNTAEIGKNSTFLIPISELDKELDIIACTEGMSAPHEIEYKIKLSSRGVSFKTSNETSENIDTEKVDNNHKLKVETNETKINTTSEASVENKVEVENETNVETETEVVEVSSPVEEVVPTEIEENDTVEDIKNEIESTEIEEINVENKSSSSIFIIVALVVVVIIAIIFIIKKRK